MMAYFRRQAVLKHFNNWLAKRQPAATEVLLSQGVIYILPTRFGWWFAFLITLLYLLGTNYQNNLLLLLSFIFFSIFISSMLLGFLNLHQLRITIKHDHECYATEPSSLPLFLANTKSAADAVPGRTRQMLNISLKGQRLVQCLPILQQETTFMLQLPQLTRGCYPLPRLLISSVYPLGLFRAWSYPALAAQIWVYPQPQHNGSQQAQAVAEHEGNNNLIGAEPDHLKHYQKGDNLKRIVWKKLASSPHQPVVRELSQQSVPLPNWVVVPALHNAALEQALSEACFMLLELEQRGQIYGLKLPQLQLEPSSGPAHLQRCLRELALC